MEISAFRVNVLNLGTKECSWVQSIERLSSGLTGIWTSRDKMSRDYWSGGSRVFLYWVHSWKKDNRRTLRKTLDTTASNDSCRIICLCMLYTSTRKLEIPRIGICRVVLEGTYRMLLSCHGVRCWKAVVELVPFPSLTHDSVPGTAAKQDLRKRPSEVPHRHGVDDGIHPRVEVSEPSEDGKQNIRSVNALDVTYPVQHISHEERNPAEAEHPHDNPKRFRCFLLLGKFAQFPAESKVFPLLGYHSGGFDVGVCVGDVVVLAGTCDGGGGGGSVVAARRQGVRAPHDVHRALVLTVTVGCSGVSHLLILKSSLQRLLVCSHVTSSVDPQCHGLTSFPVWGMHHFSTDFETVNLFCCRQVYLVISEQNNTDWNIKGDERREDQVDGIVCEHAHVWIGKNRSHTAPPENRRETDGGRADPDERDEQQGATRRHLAGIGDRVGDGPVAIQRDHGQVEDGGGARQDVYWMPHITPENRTGTLRLNVHPCKSAKTRTESVKNMHKKCEQVWTLQSKCEHCTFFRRTFAPFKGSECLISEKRARLTNSSWHSNLQTCRHTYQSFPNSQYWFVISSNIPKGITSAPEERRNKWLQSMFPFATISTEKKAGLGDKPWNISTAVKAMKTSCHVYLVKERMQWVKIFERNYHFPAQDGVSWRTISLRGRRCVSNLCRVSTNSKSPLSSWVQFLASRHIRVTWLRIRFSTLALYLSRIVVLRPQKVLSCTQTKDSSEEDLSFVLNSIVNNWYLKSCVLQFLE